MIATTFDALLRRDLDFQLYAMQGVGDLVSRERYAEHDVDSFASIIDTAYDLAGERFAPIASDLDAFEPTLRDGVVHTLPALQGALDAFIEAGFMAMGFDTKHGGMQLPHLMTVATQLIFSAANGPAGRRRGSRAARRSRLRASPRTGWSTALPCNRTATPRAPTLTSAAIAPRGTRARSPT